MTWNRLSSPGSLVTYGHVLTVHLKNPGGYEVSDSMSENPPGKESFNNFQY